MLRPGEERDSSPRLELPGTTLPWALLRILHARLVFGKPVRWPNPAADRGRADVC
jgi:hypothetical protein